MCGIAGILYKNGDLWNSSPKDLGKMLSAIVHRGPDASDIFVDGPLAMGVNRLSIIDPEPRSHQPMSSPDGLVTIAFNGEIYNFRSLREQLVRDGYQFLTLSDTEVLLALYIRHGSDCLAHLRGMFAFAIWDKHRKTLFIARDRLGEKPLVYYSDDTIFAFASELPALLASPRIPRRIDPAGIHNAMFYMHAVAPKTPFSDINKLPPAHFMEISGKRCRIERYWQGIFNQTDQFTDENECAEEIRRCFDDTVSLMSRCDTPVGALLSGGLDSSSVVASMHKVLGSFPTFRISTDGSHASAQEKNSALQVARTFGTRHHEYTLVPGDFKALEDVVHHHGEPIATAVPIDAFILAREMKKHVRVALCGAGADELFGGYREHHLLHMFDRYFRNWGELERSGQSRSAAITSKMEANASEMYEKYGRGNPELVFPSIKFKNTSLFKKIYTEKMFETAIDHDPVKICIDEYQKSRADCMFNAFICQQLNCVSQYSTAEINDRMGMAHSVEIRSPFLDVKMVELALKIPPHFKVGTSEEDTASKKIFRKAMNDRLPQATIACEKIGYGGTTPYDHWLKEECSDYVEQKLQSAALADSGLFNLRAIEELYTLYQCGADFDRDFFIGLLSIAIWMEEFL
jgi:asparagine synthase (glutamine-hydrolysing)